MIPDSSTVPQAVHTESALKIKINSTMDLKIMKHRCRVQRVTPVMSELDVNGRQKYRKPAVQME